MRVLHVDTGREMRGGQVQLLHLLRATAGDAEVALPPDAPVRAEIEALGVPVHPVDFRGSLWGALPLRTVVDRVAPDLIAAHTSHAHGHAVLAAGGRPVVVHRRVDFRPGRDPLTRAKYRAATGYVAVSGAVAAILEEAGVDPARIAVVHDGVDPEPFLRATGGEAVRDALGIPREAPLVGAVGALVPHKGHVHLVDAMAWIDNDRQDVFCVIVGEGPLRTELQARIDRWGIGSRTLLVGARDDVPAVLSALDVFCHPSVEEGMGQVVVEAMLAGVPVVASGAGGIPEVIADNETGVIVRPGAGDALARAVHATLRGRARALQRAERARSVALEHFTVDAMVEGTIEAWRRLLAP